MEIQKNKNKSFKAIKLALDGARNKHDFSQIIVHAYIWVRRKIWNVLTPGPSLNNILYK